MFADKNVVVYPFSKKFSPIVRYMANICNEIIPVAPKGLLLNEKDVSVTDGGSVLGIAIQENIDAALASCDVLLVADYDFGDNVVFQRKVLQKVYAALSMGKATYVAMTVDQNVRCQLQTYAELYNTQIRFCEDRAYPDLIVEHNTLYQQSAVVVGIGQAFPEIDTTGFVISLRDYMNKQGYRTRCLLDADYSELVKADHFPKSVLNGTYGQVIAYNHYLERMERQNKSDIIIVQFPGGLQQFSPEIPSDLGIQSYLLSQALKCDYFIYAVPFGEYDPQVVMQLSKCFEIKYNTGIDVMLLSNQAVNGEATYEALKLTYLSVEEKKVQDMLSLYQLKNSNIEMYSLQDMKRYNSVFEIMLEK